MPARQSASARAPSQQMIALALSLIGRQHHGAPQDAAAAREEFVRWRQTDARHESAALTALDYWRATAAGELQGSVALPETARAGRRRALRVLGLGLLVAGGRWVWRLPTEDFALRTERGRLLARELADGSQVHLAANTQATVRYFRDRREVTLAQGEMHFEVRRDPARPFTVSTEWGRVEVLGTGFSVRARAGGMRVAVAHGRVAVFAADRGAAVDASVVLVGGQAVDIDRYGLHAPSATRADSVAAWRDGWLVFEDTPLPDAIAQWNDYLARPIRLRDAGALASLRLSGSFPMRTPDAFMRNLPAMLAVAVERRDDAWVVGPRLARRAAE